jgi:hypothetical protein
MFLDDAAVRLGPRNHAIHCQENLDKHPWHSPSHRMRGNRHDLSTGEELLFLDHGRLPVIVDDQDLKASRHMHGKQPREVLRS